MRIHSLNLLILALSIALPSAKAEDAFELPPINYSATKPQDAVQKLEQRLSSGELQLKGGDAEVVHTLLRELAIPEESQILVFSKTSFQRTIISPDRPRSIFFNDTCYLGWVPGGLIELTAMDPQLGPVFYAFDPHAEPRPGRPRFDRDADCLRCHGGHFVQGIPSVFVRSIHTDATGEPLLQFGSEVVDYQTPFEHRWGGWYVTGLHGKTLHRGNVFAREINGKLEASPEKGANLTDLSRFFETKPYIRPTSDMVALLVFEHQVAMQNALTKASFDARRMLEYQKALARELKEEIHEEPSLDSVKRVFGNATQDVLDVLLFKDEAPLPPGGVTGVGGFTDAYQQKGGRLRDLDLKTRLMKLRCSPQIQSASFASLPGPLKRAILKRLDSTLLDTDGKSEPRYAYLGGAERSEIRSILKKTLPGYP